MALAPGKYWIQRANNGYPKPLIGVEYGPSPVKPILTEADDNVVSCFVHRHYSRDICSTLGVHIVFFYYMVE